MNLSSQVTKKEKQIGKCKHCETAIYMTEDGELLIKGSWDCIHELEIKNDSK